MLDLESECVWWCWGAHADNVTAESEFELGMEAFFDSTWEAAHWHLEHAAALGYQPALLALGDLHIKQGRLRDAEASFDRAHQAQHGDAKRVSEGYYSLGLAHRESGPGSADDQRLFRTALAVDPAHSDAAYLLACSTLDESVAHADHSYVTRLFDQYCNDFETHLVNDLEVGGPFILSASHPTPTALLRLYHLQYKSPEHLNKALAPFFEAWQTPLRVTIDAGGGTGLMVCYKVSMNQNSS